MDTLKKAWEWLKTHWQWVLFPIGIVLFVLGRLSTQRDVITTDPTAKADDRAKAEEERRKQEQDAADAALKAHLEAVREEHREKLQALTDDQLNHAAALEDDPEALNTWLRSL